MGKTDITVDAKEINSIISQVMASIQSTNNTIVQQSYFTYQASNNSSDCTNLKFSRNKLVYSNDSQIFTDMTAVQSIYVNVLNQLETTQDVDQTGGGGWGKIDETTKDTIMTMMQSALTQSEIVEFTNSFMTTDASVQVCNDSTRGTNVIMGSTKQIYDTYVEQYSQMESNQQVSADIANYLSASQSVERTGILAVLIRVIGFVAIAIIAIVVIVIAVAVLIFLK
jgi:hypothetical protein